MEALLDAQGLNKIDMSIVNEKHIEMIRKDVSNLTLITEIGFAGEMLVQANLVTKGVIPFNTNISSSEVDLIGLKGNKVYRIQVKSGICNERGSLNVDLRKSNRKYGNYSADSFDILAVVDIEKSKVAYLKWSDVYPKTKLTLRTNTYDKNYINQNVGSQGFTIFDDYLEFPEIHSKSLVV